MSEEGSATSPLPEQGHWVPFQEFPTLLFHPLKLTLPLPHTGWFYVNLTQSRAI